jgi:hypothetical protein
VHLQLLINRDFNSGLTLENSNLTLENLKIIEIYKNDRIAWEKERLALITLSDQRIATLQVRLGYATFVDKQFLCHIFV